MFINYVDVINGFLYFVNKFEKDISSEYKSHITNKMTVPRSRGRKSGIASCYRYNDDGSFHLSRHLLKKASKRSLREKKRANKKEAAHKRAEKRHTMGRCAWRESGANRESGPKLSKDEMDRVRGYCKKTVSVDWKVTMGGSGCLNPVTGETVWRVSCKNKDGDTVWNPPMPPPIEQEVWTSVAKEATGIQPGRFSEWNSYTG